MLFLFSMLTGEAHIFIFHIRDRVQHNEQQKAEHDLAAHKMWWKSGTRTRNRAAGFHPLLADSITSRSFSCGALHRMPYLPQKQQKGSTLATSIYDFTLPALDGSSIDLSAYRGQPILIVNTASQCGFTPQYEGLQALWTQFHKAGLVVIGVPSNDFGQQEPGTSEDIATFCQKNYGVAFPMAARSVVKGQNAIPLFKWLDTELGFLARPRWNFFKYLIGRNGQPVAWFSSITPPTSARVRNAVERALLPAG
jgi:glutathione peroxidase